MEANLANAEDQYDEELEDVLEEEEDQGKAGFIRGYSPMFLLSVAMHLVLLFVISLIPTEGPSDDEQVTVITTIEEEEPVEEIEEIEEIELEPTEVEVEPVETEEPVEEEVVEIIEEPVESLDDNMEEVMDLVPDEVSTVQDVSNLATLGLSGGASGASGLPSGYSKRSGKNKNKALRSGGGGRNTEGAVDAALRWLAAHQEPNGSWVAPNYEGTNTADPVTTGLALLPFLGAGHNEMSGKYKNTVRQGVKYINAEMAKLEGDYRRKFDHFGKHTNYGKAIVLMALAETSIFGSSSQTHMHGEALAKDFINQHKGEGWHYEGGGKDFSVSGWVALGLKSAKSAGFSVMESPEAKQMFESYKKWTHETMTDPVTGRGAYSPGSFSRVSMMWVGMFVKQFLGFDKYDPFLVKAAQNTVDQVKAAKYVGPDKPGDSYHIYYGTLAAFQQQGDAWRAWNPAMKKTLIGSQHRGDPKKLGGSWDPTEGSTSKSTGRVGTTALFALCLEVYYRYDIMN